MDKQETLLPCPFCSEKERVYAMPDADDEVLVTCQNCEASAWIDVWNTRPDSPAKYVPELVRALKYYAKQWPGNDEPNIAQQALSNLPEELRK